MNEVRIKSVRELPEPLPEGEHILWQRSPAWGPYARRVFQIDKIAVYFLILLAWVAGSAGLEQGALGALRAMSWAAPPALAVLGILALLAWLYARSTVYTITNRRVVIESGLAIPAAINLPFSRVERADMKSFRDGTGDVELTMSGPRILYSMLWPNLRLFRLKQPRPMLLALGNPRQVASLLGDALAAARSEGGTEADAPTRAPTRSLAPGEPLSA